MMCTYNCNISMGLQHWTQFHWKDSWKYEWTIGNYLPIISWLVIIILLGTYLTIFYYYIILYKHLVGNQIPTGNQKIKHQKTFSISQNFKLLNEKNLWSKIYWRFKFNSKITFLLYCEYLLYIFNWFIFNLIVFFLIVIER